MSARDRMTPEQRTALAKQLDDAKPARTELIESFGKSIVDRREHEHPKWEDLFCLNLSSYMGERMAPVLRRLIDAERDADRYRTAWRLARGRAISTGGAADRYAARANELQTALQDSLVAVIGSSIERKAIRAEVLREAADAIVADNDRQLWASKPGKHWAADLLRRMADAAEHGEKDTAPAATSTPQPAELTIYRASHDSIVMGLYTTAAEARKHCETELRREHDASTSAKSWWREDEDTVDQPEDGEQELWEHVKSAAVPGPGFTRPTGYIVTPLTVASAYDEEADE